MTAIPALLSFTAQSDANKQPQADTRIELNLLVYITLGILLYSLWMMLCCCLFTAISLCPHLQEYDDYQSMELKLLIELGVVQVNNSTED